MHEEMLAELNVHIEDILIGAHERFAESRYIRSNENINTSGIFTFSPNKLIEDMDELDSIAEIHLLELKKMTHLEYQMKRDEYSSHIYQHKARKGPIIEEPLKASISNAGTVCIKANGIECTPLTKSEALTFAAILVYAPQVPHLLESDDFKMSGMSMLNHANLSIGEDCWRMPSALSVDSGIQLLDFLML